MSLLDRRRLHDLETPVRDLSGRILDLGVSAYDGTALPRAEETYLLERVLADTVLAPDMRAAFRSRLEVLRSHR